VRPIYEPNVYQKASDTKNHDYGLTLSDIMFIPILMKIRRLVKKTASGAEFSCWNLFNGNVTTEQWRSMTFTKM
jgi:hypothetical protein